MFNRIPNDVVEIVVVYSRSCDLYKQLKELVKKFKDKCIETRVRDKLTVKYIYNNAICYTLNGVDNREYNKPCYVSRYNSFLHENCCIYKRNMHRTNIDLPHRVCFDGLRSYYNRSIDLKGCRYCLYRIRNNYYYESGYRNISYIQYNILDLK